MKCASSQRCSASFHERISARASAPVMKNSSSSGRSRPDVAQGVDRERRAGPVDVDPADGEARVGGRRDDGHEVAVLGRRDVAVGLLPRLPGGDEDDLVEVEARLDLTGGHEVAVVDRVERPTHDAEAHGQWWAPSDPLELPCVPWVGRAAPGRLHLVGGVAEAPRDAEGHEEQRERDEEVGDHRQGKLARSFLPLGDECEDTIRHAPSLAPAVVCRPPGSRANRSPVLRARRSHSWPTVASAVAAAPRRHVAYTRTRDGRVGTPLVGRTRAIAGHGQQGASTSGGTWTGRTWGTRRP